MSPKIRKFWISREELESIQAGQQPPINIDATNVGGLTAGSIPFADADGFLTENNAALFWDAANEILKITSATTLLLDLYPGFTGTGEVINITPSAAIDTIDAEWDGIVIDCNALDPSAIGVHIHGIHLDFSTVDLTNDPHLDGIHIVMPSCLCGAHAIHLEGELHINLDAADAVIGETYTGLDVVIATVGSTGGDLHVLDVARSGVGAVAIAAVATHEGIDVIHQAIGTFAAADKIWEYDNDGPTWIDVTAGVGSIWDDKDDLLYVGHASTFSEIKFMFSVMATKDMHFKFYFSTGGAGWTQFYPADDTNGATQDGSVRYTAASLPTWAIDTVNGIADKYWIRIERTRTSGTGPTTSSMQQLAPTLYGWDKDGKITALTATFTTAIFTSITLDDIKCATDADQHIYMDIVDEIRIHPGYVATDNYIILKSVDDTVVSPQFYPSADGEGQLGISTNRWNALFLSGNLSDGTNTVTIAALPDKTTGAWTKSIGGGGDYADWATMIADMPDLIAHDVTITIEKGTTLTEICNLKNKHGLTVSAAIIVQSERYYPTAGALPTGDSATATTLRDAALAAEAFGNDYFNGCWIFIVHGTGTDNGFVPITDYVDATGDVVVAAWPGTQPDNTSRYLIVGALIDGGSARARCAHIMYNTCPVFFYGIGMKDSTVRLWQGEYNFYAEARYCGFYNTVYSGVYNVVCLRTYFAYNGVVKCNTSNDVGEAGYWFNACSHGYVWECGISDNNQRGIFVTSNSFIGITDNFGDNNGAWGTYANDSGQAKMGGAECSGAAGNHSDPGTAGNANADQAAAY